MFHGSPPPDGTVPHRYHRLPSSIARLSTPRQWFNWRVDGKTHRDDDGHIVPKWLSIEETPPDTDPSERTQSVSILGESIAAIGDWWWFNDTTREYYPDTPNNPRAVGMERWKAVGLVEQQSHYCAM